jgi:hypothetical protein
MSSSRTTIEIGKSGNLIGHAIDRRVEIADVMNAAGSDANIVLDVLWRQHLSSHIINTSSTTHHRQQQT